MATRELSPRIGYSKGMALSEFLDHTMRYPRPFALSEARVTVSPDGLEAAVTRGELTRVLPGQYANAVHGDSWTVRSLATCMWMPPGGALTGRAALYAQGYIDDVPDVIDVVVPRGRHRKGPDWMRIVSQTHPIDALVTPDGLITAQPELAVIHAFAREPEYSRATLVYSACAGGRVDPGRVRELLERLPRVARRRVLERLLDHAADGVESFLEERGATKVLTGTAFSDVIRQHRLVVQREAFRLDAYDPATRTAFEFDSETWHGKPEQREYDLRRDALLAGVGILTTRFGYWDVMRRPKWCRQVALKVLAQRAA